MSKGDYKAVFVDRRAQDKSGYNRVGCYGPVCSVLSFFSG
jgi:hypothetical protein